MTYSHQKGLIGQFTFDSFGERDLVGLHPQSNFESYDRIVSSLGPEDTYFDESQILGVLQVPLEFVPPEQVPAWSRTSIQTFKAAKSHSRREDSPLNDIRQGELGECWFLSALSILSLNGRVREVLTRYDERKGVYEFRFFGWDERRGKFSPIYVCVDRMIPVVHGHAMPAFCYSEEPGELWPSLLEKAFAKAIRIWRGQSDLGSPGYQALTEAGMPCVALAHMLGGKTGCFYGPERALQATPEDVESFGQFFADMMEAGTFLFATFRGVLGRTNEAGLISSHTYPITRLELFSISGDRFRLLQLRTPFGTDLGEWTGDWSRDSRLWYNHSQAAELCTSQGDREGFFWMSLTDFLHHLQSFDVCGTGFEEAFSKARGRDPVSPPASNYSPDAGAVIPYEKNHSLDRLQRKLMESEQACHGLKKEIAEERIQRQHLEDVVDSLARETNQLKQRATGLDTPRDTSIVVPTPLAITNGPVIEPSPAYLPPPYTAPITPLSTVTVGAGSTHGRPERYTPRGRYHTRSTSPVAPRATTPIALDSTPISVSHPRGLSRSGSMGNPNSVYRAASGRTFVPESEEVNEMGGTTRYYHIGDPSLDAYSPDLALAPAQPFHRPSIGGIGSRGRRGYGSDYASLPQTQDPIYDLPSTSVYKGSTSSSGRSGGNRPSHTSTVRTSSNYRPRSPRRAGTGTLFYEKADGTTIVNPHDHELPAPVKAAHDRILSRSSAGSHYKDQPSRQTRPSSRNSHI